MEDFDKMSFKDVIEKSKKDCPDGMSFFQIERFLIESEPPVGRYFQACREIKARQENIDDLEEALSREDDAKKKSKMERDILSLKKELEHFVCLAKKWYPATKGLSYEDIQGEYWDQKLGWQLCMRLLVRESIGDLIEPILKLPDGSCSKNMVKAILSGDPQITQKALIYVAEKGNLEIGYGE